MSVLGAVLLLAAGQGAVETAAKPTDGAAKMICRRGKETGSRVRAKRTCHTREEWNEIDAAAQRGFENSRTISRPTG